MIENLEIHPSNNFSDFFLKNDNLGLKMKILKFLRIQPRYGQYDEVGCVFPMVVVPILPHVEFGRNDPR